jgi:hypothetical protein
MKTLSWNSPLTDKLEDMMATAPKSSLASAMADAFAEFEAAAKAANNPHFKSKYADLPAVMDAIKPALVKNRLFFTQATHEMDGGVCIETVVHHESGEHMSFGRLFVPASKQDAHGYGSALTYARRYSLMTAFGIPAEDDDGNAAAKSINGNAKAPTGKIDDAQYATLTTMIEKYGADTTKFLRHFKVNTVNDLPAARFKEAVDSLDEFHRAKLARLTQKNGKAAEHATAQ